MNEVGLLEHYERIADAPDAIARLRRFVLDLAVRGKLVPQDPEDEPASELLKRIAAEKARLVTLGKFREPLSFVKIEREAQPFVPPAHWCWARLIDIAQPSYGFAFASGQFNSQRRGMPLIRIRDISRTDTEAYFEGDFDPSYLVKAGDYLAGMDGNFNLRRWKGIDGLLNQRVMRIIGWRCGVDPEFIKLPLQFILDHLHTETSLTTVKHLSAKQVNGIEIPLPPLAEQNRIVAKVDELMALCDRLAAARAERETTRDRLAASSLARLNAPDPETFQDDARFVLDALRAITTRPDQIKQLRQTILNLAVRGKLVPQDPRDEPASELLKCIAAEKARLVKAGKTKKERPLPSIDYGQEPFDLPNSWKWSRLRTLAITIGDGLHGTPTYSKEEECYFINGNNLSNGRIVIKSSTKTVSSDERQKYMKPLSSRSVLVSINGTLGNVAFYNDENVILGKSVCYFNLTEFTNREFAKVVIESPYFVSYALQNATGTTIMNLSLKAINEFPYPFPPLAEQHRIVIRVAELMALCDQLEASLGDSAATRRRFLDELLAEAFVPAESREPETIGARQSSCQAIMLLDAVQTIA